ncbi:MAG: outer rane immunogenic protein [Hyphomicrobiales bacterium]|jgi:outer membrane immunogenic protein|nr:outer rane immunogenic protein [Hyphomicrobiales bacterium]
MRLFLGTLSALVLSAPIAAVAADLPPRPLPVKAPVMAPVVYNWTGFYIGGNVGYSFGRDPYEVAGTSTIRTRTFRAFGTPAETLTSDVTAAGPGFVGAGTANIDGGVAGGQIGYNWQTSAWVFGLETDAQWTGQRGSTSFCLTVGCPVGGFVANADYKLQWFGTARARAGLLVDPRVLLYVTGGAAYGQVKADYASGILGLPLVGSSISTTRLGWTIGGGIEAMLSPNWTVKAEYLYVDLGSVASGALGGATTATLANVPQQGFTTVVDTTFAGAATTRVRDNIVRVGINYHVMP